MNATIADTSVLEPAERRDLDKGLGAAGMFGFGAAIFATLLYVAYSVYSDAAAAGVHATAYLPFILLFIALLIALGLFRPPMRSTARCPRNMCRSLS